MKYSISMSKIIPSGKAMQLFLLIGCLFVTGIAPAAEPDAAITAEREDKLSTLPLHDLRTFVEVYSRIKQSYVEHVDDKTLLKNAIHGMLAGLDPYSAYLDGNSYKSLKENTAGKFGGIGIEISARDGLIEIIAPIEDTPASRSGLLPGDLISEISHSFCCFISLFTPWT